MTYFFELSVTENANASDDSGIRAKEAWCENRTLRRDACQVSLKIHNAISTRMNGSTNSWTSSLSATTTNHHHCFLAKPNCSSKREWEKNPRIIYCASTFSLIYVLFHFFCATFYYSDYYFFFFKFILILLISLVLFLVSFLSLNYSNR